MNQGESQSNARTPENLDVRLEKPYFRNVGYDFQSVTADRKSLFYVARPLQILEVQGIVEGTGPSAVCDIQYSKDTTTFTSLFNLTFTIDSVTIPELFYPDVPLVPKAVWLWVNVASVGGTVDHLHLSLTYEQ